MVEILRDEMGKSITTKSLMAEFLKEKCHPLKDKISHVGEKMTVSNPLVKKKLTVS